MLRILFILFMGLLLTEQSARAMVWGTFRTSSNIVDRRLCTGDPNSTTKKLPEQAVSYQDAVCRMSEAAAHMGSVYHDLALQENCPDANEAFRLFFTWMKIDGGKMAKDDPLLALKKETEVDGPNDAGELNAPISDSDSCTGSFRATQKVLAEKMKRVRDARAELVSNYEKHAKAAVYIADQTARYAYKGCEPKSDRGRWYAAQEAGSTKSLSGPTGGMNITYIVYVVDGAKDFKTAYDATDAFLVKKLEFLKQAWSKLEFASGKGLRCGKLR